MQLIDEVIGYAKANAEASGPCKDAWDAHRRNCVLIKTEIEAIEPHLKTIIYLCEKSAPVSEGDWKDYTIMIRNLIAREAREAMAAFSKGTST